MALPKDVCSGPIDWDHVYKLESNRLKSKDYSLEVLEHQLIEIGFKKNEFGVEFNHQGYTIYFKCYISPAIKSKIESKGYRVIINHAKN